MRVLDRATTIVSVLAAVPGQGLDELAARTDMPRSTCARLLAALTALGWCERAGPGRWVLGPRAQALAEGRPYHTGLVAALAPAMIRAARRLAQPVALSVIRGGRRLVLVRFEADGSEAKRLTVDDDHDLAFSTAGKVLIAMQAPAERRRLVRTVTVPDPGWPGVADRAEQLWHLREIARERALGETKGRLRCWSVAVPDGQGGWAALGTFAPVPGHPRARQVLEGVVNP